MSLAGKFLPKALAAVGKFRAASSCYLERTSGAYDPATGAVVIGATSTSYPITCTGLQSNRLFGRTDGAVGSAEGVVYIAASGLSVQPTRQDVLIVDGVRYSIAEIATASVNSVDILYTIYVRKGGA